MKQSLRIFQKYNFPSLTMVIRVILKLICQHHLLHICNSEVPESRSWISYKLLSTVFQDHSQSSFFRIILTFKVQLNKQNSVISQNVFQNISLSSGFYIVKNIDLIIENNFVRIIFFLIIITADLKKTEFTKRNKHQ